MRKLGNCHENPTGTRICIAVKSAHWIWSDNLKNSQNPIWAFSATGGWHCQSSKMILPEAIVLLYLYHLYYKGIARHIFDVIRLFQVIHDFYAFCINRSYIKNHPHMKLYNVQIFPRPPASFSSDWLFTWKYFSWLNSMYFAGNELFPEFQPHSELTKKCLYADYWLNCKSVVWNITRVTCRKPALSVLLFPPSK